LKFSSAPKGELSKTLYQAELIKELIMSKCNDIDLAVTICRLVLLSHKSANFPLEDSKATKV